MFWCCLSSTTGQAVGFITMVIFGPDLNQNSVICLTGAGVLMNKVWRKLMSMKLCFYLWYSQALSSGRMYQDFKSSIILWFLNRSLNTLTKAHSIRNRSWKRKCQQIILQMKAVRSCIHFSSPTVKILLRETHNSFQSSKGILVPRCWREATSFLKNSPKLLLLSFDRICSVTDNCLFALCWKWKNIRFNHLGQIAWWSQCAALTLSSQKLLFVLLEDTTCWWEHWAVCACGGDVPAVFH